MAYPPFSKDTTHCELADGYALVSAPERAFGISYAVYRKTNTEFFQTFLEYGSDLEGLHYCFWVTRHGERVGGIIIRPNHIEGLFVIPPFIDAYRVLEAAMPVLLDWSDPTKDIEAVDVLPHELDLYHRLGFRADCIRRHMIRPTQAFDVGWESRFEAIVPAEEHQPAIASLLHESFTGGVAKYGTCGLDDWRTNIARFARRKTSYPDASTLVFDRDTGALVGACLTWLDVEDAIAGIGWLAVSPSYQRRGLATRMLKRAMTVLSGKCPLVKVQVFVGNPAEALYYRLGFLPGVDRHTLSMPASQN